MRPPAHPPGVGVPAEAARRAAVGPWAVLAFSALYGMFSGFFFAPLGYVFAAVGVVGSVTLFLAAERVRRLARWTTAVEFIAALQFFGGFLVIAAAVATTRFDPWVLLWAALAMSVTVAVRWRRSLDRRTREWERSQQINEREVLDFETASYDVARGFVYDPDATASAPASAQRKLARASRWIAVGTPIALILGRCGGGDPRPTFVMFVGPAILLTTLPVIALVYTNWRQIRRYERRLGRDIVNR